jgi:6-phosphofructokinase 2
MPFAPLTGMKPIWTLTMNPAIDLGSQVDRVEPDRKLRCERGRFEAGGGGVNVARALKRLGADATAVFPGGGALGSYYRELVEDQGVTTRTFSIHRDMQRINLNVRDLDSGDQFRFCLPGARIDDEEWGRVLALFDEVVQSEALVVISGSLPPGVPDDFPARLAQAVEAAGGRSLIDAPGPVLKALAGTPVDWITPNLKEFSTILGHEPDRENLEEEARTLTRQTGVCNLLLTLGPEGVVYSGTEGTHFLQAPAVDKVSAVGAGDSTVAGLVFALARGESHSDAVHSAVAAGSAAVMTPGSELLRQEDYQACSEKMAGRA